jgi:hypothetical protein
MYSATVIPTRAAQNIATGTINVGQSFGIGTRIVNFSSFWANMKSNMQGACPPLCSVRRDDLSFFENSRFVPFQ